MARDYKKRTQSRSRQDKAQSVAWWKWLAIVLLLSGFAWFLNSLSDSPVKKDDGQYSKLPVKKPNKNIKASSVPKNQKKANNLTEPEFDFYKILETSEVIVSEYETKTIVREERIGKAKPAKYIMQAGAFKDYKQADKLKAQLTLLGLEPKIERVGVWNRVKIGPYSKMSSVNIITKRLKQNGFDVIVTKVGG
jgi:cell division protein FtsN